jgi:phage-related tail protein
MAEIVTVKLVAETGDAVKNVEKVEKSVQKTGIASKKASKELSGLEQAGGAVIGKLDRVTGGLASKFVAVGKAAKLSGKAMKTALISSGIGLAVVALSLIVEYWDDISEALGFVNNDL